MFNADLIYGPGFRLWGCMAFQGSGSQVWDSGFVAVEADGLGIKVWGLGSFEAKELAIDCWSSLNPKP